LSVRPKTLLATGADDGNVTLWSTSDWLPVHFLTGHSDWVESVAFSPDGKTLASGSGDGAVGLWDVKSGRTLHRLSGNDGQITSVAFSKDGDTVAAGNRRKTIVLWRVSDGSRLATLPSGPDWVNAVAYSPAGGVLGSVSGKGASLWNTTSRKVIHKIPLTAIGTSICFSRDGKTAAIGTDFGEVTIIEVATGTKLRHSSRHTKTVMALAFSPDGNFLASGDLGMTVRLWNSATMQEAHQFSFKSAVNSLAFSPNGRTLAVVLRDGTAEIWNVP